MTQPAPPADDGTVEMSRTYDAERDNWQTTTERVTLIRSLAERIAADRQRQATMAELLKRMEAALRRAGGNVTS